MALGIEDLRVGTWEAPSGSSGCTVVLPPAGTVGAMAVRGQAPGTREAMALQPAGRVEVCHAVVLAGGSAYGLAAADGVARWLEEHGVGHPVTGGVVPIVGAMIVFDLAATDPDSRPGADAGRAACDAATTVDPADGRVGAGAGVTVAKVAGIGHAWRSGQAAAVARHDGLIVSALVVNNGVGEVVGGDGGVLVGARAPAGAPRFPADPQVLAPAGGAGGVTTNTVIGCVTTNARLSKLDVHRVADLAHDGVAAAMRPAHTSLDGDAIVALSVPRVAAPLDLVVSLAVEAVATATRRGPLAATSGADLPGMADVGL